ncbi:MAG: DUF4870 domain-containing protein [Chitinivibrionales bacterium]|nr:DUF4870 domain-containing protein [Chitinivibrionales bacterium]
MEPAPAPIPIPQPHEISDREKEDAMGSYLMMFAAWGAGLPLPIINLIAAVIYFFINKKTSPFVAFHSFQSLLTQIPITLFNAGVIFWLIMIISPYAEDTVYFYSYLVFVVLWNLIYMVFSIIACLQARKGKLYYFWVFGRLAFARYFGTKAKKKREEVNRPPEGF